MDSPSAQLMHGAEQSMTNLDDNEASSPFVSEADSRLVSKQWDAWVESKEEESMDMDIFATPAVSPQKAVLAQMVEDKENMPQLEDTTHKRVSSPRRPTTPEQRKSSRPEMNALPDSDLMPPPPPSTRKVQATPKAKTPLRHEHAEFTRTTTRTSTESLEVRAHAITEDNSNIDDSCFSAFSEVPQLSAWAKLTHSPTKTLSTPAKPSDATPRTTRKRPSPSRSPSPTPRRMRTPRHGHTQSHDATTFLIDFTEQLGNVNRMSPSRTQPDLLKYMHDQRSPHKSTRQTYATPAKQNNILNLLDFDLPPAPTPRSVPTITVRELESLKSSYLSQISSLKATLSGREAEVESLKRAVGDAERRVGEAQEALRDEKNKREYAEQEKAGWERRGQEVENVLKNVKEEVLKSEAEKEELARKVEEAERRAEEAEARSAKAEEQFADALAARANSGDADAKAMEEQVQRLVAVQIDSKIEAVSRELHSVYKEKHERKVATLKKSYEARADKKLADMQSRLNELEKQNVDLIAAKDATFSGPVTDSTAFIEAEADLKAQLEEQRAHLARIECEMQTSREHQQELERQLEQERIEKGDLVAAVDEMLLLQSEQGPAQGAMAVVEDFRKSVSRPRSAMSSSALRAPGCSVPGPGGSKIGGVGRAGSGGGKGGMMSRIEKMGRAHGGEVENEAHEGDEGEAFATSRPAQCSHPSSPDSKSHLPSPFPCTFLPPFPIIQSSPHTFINDTATMSTRTSKRKAEDEEELVELPEDGSDEEEEYESEGDDYEEGDEDDEEEEEGDEDAEEAAPAPKPAKRQKTASKTADDDDEEAENELDDDDAEPEQDAPDDDEDAEHTATKGGPAAAAKKNKANHVPKEDDLEEEEEEVDDAEDEN
ncbi:hypothetical protein AC578_1786 [Pseudocercospora eumusae]|uniref:Uncharacterized protein n=1 Tax=Pseudocercospora eumusae TaxID=321146 RepID=A0A139GWM1_9PEZI|nr:hypothetical protein AC578_1786 [Pseudocercospora eumusae]